MEVLSTPERAWVAAGGGSGAKRSRGNNKGKKLWERTGRGGGACVDYGGRDGKEGEKGLQSDIGK